MSAAVDEDTVEAEELLVAIVVVIAIMLDEEVIARSLVVEALRLSKIDELLEVPDEVATLNEDAVAELLGLVET